MENASKALIIATGVLIGISILSLAIYLFVTFGSTAARANEEIRTNQINQFNGQYTSYLGREDLTIHDVVTVINKATENNIYYGYDSRKDRNKRGENYISVKINNEYKELGKETSAKISNIWSTILVKMYSGAEMQKFQCRNILISDITKRVYEIQYFEK